MNIVAGTTALLAANAASILAAAAIVRRFQLASPAQSFVALLLVRLALISMTVVAAGSLSVLDPLTLGLVGAFAAAGLILAGEHVRAVKLLHRPACSRIAAVLAVLLLVRFAIQAWLFAPYCFDALSYHLPKVAEWIRAGSFTREMGVDTHAALPAGFELIEAWWVVFLRHDVLIEAAGGEFLLLAAASVYSLARTCGLGPDGAVLAALAYVLTPSLHFQATASLNDGPVAALVLATASLMAAPTPLAVVLVPVGLGLGVKATFVFALPGLALLLAARHDRPRCASTLARVAACGALATGLFWYFRNTVLFGNPFHPVGPGGFTSPSGLPLIQFGFNFGSGLSNLLALFDRVHDRMSPPHPMIENALGWGGLAFAGIIPLVAVTRQNRVFRILLGSFALSLTTILFLTNHDRWNSRFFLFFPALIAIAVARFAQDSREARAILYAGLLAQFAYTTVPADRFLVGALPRLVEASWRERSLLEDIKPLREHEVVAYLSTEPDYRRGEAYLLYGPDFRRRVVYLRSTRAEHMVREMAENGARLLYLATPSVSDVWVREAAARGHLRPISERLYELHPAHPLER